MKPLSTILLLCLCLTARAQTNVIPSPPALPIVARPRMPSVMTPVPVIVSQKVTLSWNTNGADCYTVWASSNLTNWYVVGYTTTNVIHYDQSYLTPMLIFGVKAEFESPMSATITNTITVTNITQ
jgi:hypothetical protein